MFFLLWHWNRVWCGMKMFELDTYDFFDKCFIFLSIKLFWTIQLLWSLKQWLLLKKTETSYALKFNWWKLLKFFEYRENLINQTDRDFATKTIGTCENNFLNVENTCILKWNNTPWFLSSQKFSRSTEKKICRNVGIDELCVGFFSTRHQL